MHITQADALKNDKRETIYKLWSQLYDITPKICKAISRKQEDNETTILLLKQTIKIAQEALEKFKLKTKPTGGTL